MQARQHSQCVTQSHFACPRSSELGNINAASCLQQHLPPRQAARLWLTRTSRASASCCSSGKVRAQAARHSVGFCAASRQPRHTHATAPSAYTDGRWLSTSAIISSGNSCCMGDSSTCRTSARSSEQQSHAWQQPSISGSQALTLCIRGVVSPAAVLRAALHILANNSLQQH